MLQRIFKIGSKTTQKNPTRDLIGLVMNGNTIALPYTLTVQPQEFSIFPLLLLQVV